VPHHEQFYRTLTSCKQLRDKSARRLSYVQLTEEVVRRVPAGEAEMFEIIRLRLARTDRSRRKDMLFVADSLNNRVAAIHHALIRKTSGRTGRTVSKGGALNDPLGMSLSPNGHILTANGDDGKIVETDPRNGRQVAVKLVDNSGGPPPGLIGPRPLTGRRRSRDRPAPSLCHFRSDPARCLG